MVEAPGDCTVLKAPSLLIIVLVMMEPGVACERPDQTGGTEAPEPGRQSAQTLADAVCDVLDGSGELGEEGDGALPNVVFLGPGLRHRLAELRGMEPPSNEVARVACTYELLSGDAPEPIGDGSCGLHAVFRRENSPVLGVRLRYEASLDSLHVCGFWTPSVTH